MAGTARGRRTSGAKKSHDALAVHPQLEEIVCRKVASGMYTSASEVVRKALRLLEEQDQMRAVRLDRLCSDIRASSKAVRAGRPGEPEALKSTTG